MLTNRLDSYNVCAGIPVALDSEAQLATPSSRVETLVLIAKVTVA